MHEVLVNRLGGLSLPRKSVVRLTDRPDMILDVDRGRKTTIQQQQSIKRTEDKPIHFITIFVWKCKAISCKISFSHNSRSFYLLYTVK